MRECNPVKTLAGIFYDVNILELMGIKEKKYDQ